MKFSRFINILAVTAMMFATLGFSYAPAAAQSGGPEFDRDALYVPGELIVTFGRGATRGEAHASALKISKSFHGEVMRSGEQSSLLSFDEDADIESLAQEIVRQPGVVRVEPNYIRWIPESEPGATAHTLDSVKFRGADGSTRFVSMDQLKKMRTVKKVNGRTQAVPSYPVEGYGQWGWWSSSANIIWPEKVVSPAVCVIDTGVDAKHPDFMAGSSSRIINGYDFVDDDATPNDDNGHGTHVAGTITAVMNNKKGVSGISNGKVVAVRVLTAQGWGTSWNIGEGIEYCANRTDVKVINMSLGGAAASSWEFAALEYAVTPTTTVISSGPFAGLKGKGKLVVVAAGNESTSNYSFPAAWAAPFVCANGSDTYPLDCADNTIDQALISVGASRSWFSINSDTNADGFLWVDTDGDGLEDGNELYYPDECAADFSNYGAWVNITAPGEDILSTVPYSYPFYDEYYWGEDPDNDGYESYSGTSMAAPHVAAAAARTWSVFPAFTNANVKTQLLATGDTFLSFASDPNMTDPTAGYADTGYQGEAPYCWPDATNGVFYDSSHLVHLNVAAAMNRGALWAEVYDAVSGIPLKGATVKAFIGATLKDTTTLAFDGEYYTDLLNLPAGATVDVKVNKAGYTYGDQVVAHHVVPAGYFDWGPWLTVGVPPNNKRIHVVADWEFANSDLDLFTWEANVTGPGFIVGPWDPGSPSGFYIDEGDLTDVPYARWNRDGGFGDFLPMESISIAPKPGTTNIPYYNATVADYYDFLVTDYADPGMLNNYVIVRVWVGGKIIGFAEKFNTCDTDGANNIAGDGDDEVWWWAGSMNKGVYTPGDFCGVGDTWANNPTDGAWPYRENTRDSTSGIPGRPGTK